MAIEKTYSSKDSKSYITEKAARNAVTKAQLKAGGECSYMLAHCPVSNKFVPIILASDNPISYAQQGFRTFG